MGFFEEIAKISTPARNVPFFGKTIGGGIENWSNPVTQLSDRNPLLALIKGDFDWSTLGSNKPPTKTEEDINNINVLLASIYGGAMAGSAAYGASGAGAEGGGGFLQNLMGSGGSGSEGSGFLSKLMGSGGSQSPYNIQNAFRLYNLINNLQQQRNKKIQTDVTKGGL
jgi:hypothetical protein